MIVQIEIPDDAIKQEGDVDNDDIINTIDSGVHYMFRVYSYYHISNSDIKISIK